MVQTVEGVAHVWSVECVEIVEVWSMAWILCRVWTVRNVWMMWRPWRPCRVCSGQSCGDGANGEGSGSCVERGVCGDSGGVEHGVDTV